MSEKVNELEPTRCLEEDQNTPKIAVVTSVSGFPVKDREYVTVDQARKRRKNREADAQLRKGRTAV